MLPRSDALPEPRPDARDRVGAGLSEPELAGHGRMGTADDGCRDLPRAAVGEGGAGTIIATVDLSSLTSQQLSSTDSNEVEDLGILAIAGGGGGGSFASRSTVDLTNEISPLILGSGDAEIQSQVAVTFQVLPASN